MRRTHLLGMVAAAVACSTPTGTIALITGADDPFAMAPLPTLLDIDAVNQDGGVTQLAQSPLPTSSVNLGGQGFNATESLLAEGFDDAGAMVLWGEALPLQLGDIEGTTLPIFVQRTGAFARMPNPLAVAPVSPLVTMLDGRFILAAGGSTTALSTTSELYDLVSWTPLSLPPTLPIAPTSIAVVGTQALLIDKAGDAMWFDFSDSSTTTPTSPFSDGTFASVAGGATVLAPDGTQYLVGSTRSAGAATNAILMIDTAENLKSASLQTARLGAAATWINGSLVVLGGSGASGAGGIEILGTSSTTPAYPPDPTMGAGATALDGTHVLLVGGLTASDAGTGPAPTRVFDVTCSGVCTPDTTSWPTPPVALVSAQAFTLPPGVSTGVFVVGNDAGNMTHGFKIGSAMDAGVVTETPFKVARSGASAVRLPMGPIAVVGGDVNIESFAP